MMIETLAAERQAELLRQAETYRRIRAARRGGARLPRASVSSLVARAAASLRRPASVAAHPQACCA